MQLDTGSDVTYLYDDGTLARRRGWPVERVGQNDRTRVPTVRLGGQTLGPLPLTLRPDLHVGPIAGTVGLDALIGYVVVLDFPQQRFCVMRRGDVPTDLARRIQWVNGEVRDGKFFIKPSVDGRPLDGIIFDTGSSAEALSVDYGLWRDITGREAQNPANTRQSLRSWGKTVTSVSAPARGALEIGSIRIDAPPVSFRQEQPEFFRSWPMRAQGLMGNAPFLRDVLVLSFGARPSLGILR